MSRAAARLHREVSRVARLLGGCIACAAAARRRPKPVPQPRATAWGGGTTRTVAASLAYLPSSRLGHLRGDVRHRDIITQQNIDQLVQPLEYRSTSVATSAMA